MAFDGAAVRIFRGSCGGCRVGSGSGGVLGVATIYVMAREDQSLPAGRPAVPTVTERNNLLRFGRARGVGAGPFGLRRNGSSTARPLARSMPPAGLFFSIIRRSRRQVETGSTINTAFEWLRQVLADPETPPPPGAIRRRFSEGGIGLVWARVPPGDGAQEGEARTQRFMVAPHQESPTPEPLTGPGRAWVDQSAFVIDDGGADVTLVLGAEIRHLARGEGGMEVVARAARAVAAWRRTQVRLERKAARMDALLAYCEALHGSRSSADVAAALRRHAAEVVGGRAALAAFRDPLVAPDPAARDADLVFDAGHLGLAEIRLRSAAGRVVSGLIEPADAVEGAPYAALAPLFSEHGAVALLHTPVGRFGLLLITERRSDRVIEGEDWEILHAVARHAEAALERIAAHAVHAAG
jgi:hypothetical protein